ncbi:hypothetical protein ACL2XP_07570 [Sodalis sp. RH21]|uniref:hypothetical protein n=1 Tax=unclassified Sodalis (in: enterobacteria) TaxID=2636512 RepID=UPI0039B55DF6
MQLTEYHGKDMARQNIILGISIVLGIILSYYFVTFNFSADNDVANSAIVWHEVQKHGLSVLSQWRPTPDNWYFSTYPIHFLLFKLTGSSSPRVIQFIEIAQVFLGALIAAMICFRKTRSQYSFLLIPFFCGLSQFAYTVGYISHPFSHNLTNVYGLLCIYLYMVKPKNANFFYEIGICALILVASVSDPWFQAAYYLPLLLVSLYKTLVAKTQSKKALLPLFITGIILFTHLIERVLHLPVAHFSLGSPQQMLANGYWFLVGLGGNLNLFFVQNNSVNIASSVIVIVLYLFSMAKLNKRDDVDFIIFFSLAGITSAFILSSTPGAAYSARFFVNIVYLAIIALFASALQSKRESIMLYLAILFLSGLYSHWNVPPRDSDRPLVELRTFLEKNNLHDGFGPYWGSQTLAMAWNTQWNTLIRPVAFDKKTGYMQLGGRSQTFDYWYTPETNSDAKRQFIAILSDGEECADLTLCLNGVSKQFGEPDEKLSFNGMLFYVYNRPIVAYSVPELSPAGEILFGQSAENYFWKGWSEPEAGFRWTEGLSTEIKVHQASPWSQGRFLIAASSYQPIKGAIYYNGDKIQDLDLPAGEHNIDFIIHNAGHGKGKITLGFAFDALKSPKEMGASIDGRRLGLSFKKIEYRFE